MIKHIWTVVCKESKVDAETNNLSIIDILENVQFQAQVNGADFNANQGNPIAIPLGMQIASLFFREAKTGEESIDVKTKILDPKGKQLGEIDNVVKFQNGLNRMRNIIKFNSLAVTEDGTYLFQVFVREKSGFKNVATIPVDVSLNISKVPMALNNYSL
jgi:hypothetical protein